MIPINKKHIIKALKYIFSIGLSLIILAILAGGALFFYYVSSAPKLSESQLKATSSSLVYDSQNNLIADLGSEKRSSVTSDNIPINLVNAVTAIEDHRFFKHRGVDIFRIMGAAWNNLTSDRTQGGSTLDQQLIKLAYFSTDSSDQTLKRKAQEAWLALKMEREYTKEEILTFYINKVYMGNGNYGMLTAAKSYYGKDLTELSIDKIALLAGIPQAPSQYDPYTNPEAAKERRDIVLGQMLRYENITQEEYDAAVATPITDGLQVLTSNNEVPDYLDNYLKEVIEQVEEKTGADIFTSGLKVYTNVDIAAQQYLYDIFNSDSYVAYPDDEIQVASTVMDVNTGKVIAQLGTRHQTEDVTFGTNQATLTDRDWGSTMKPISAYAPALESGTYTSTAQSLNDSIYYWPGTSIQLYNWDLQYYGWMTMQTAIMQSRNVPAARALEATGLDYAQSFLEGLGIYYPEMQYANALSSNTSSSDTKYGASSEKMAAAYAAFANGGTYHEPQYVNRIEFSDGTVQTYDSAGTTAMKETTAYMMTDMLKTVLYYGNGINAQISGVVQAGKTGTSNYTATELASIEAETGIYNSVVGTMAPDSTYVGYTTNYSMAVWTGYKNRLTPVYGDGLVISTNVYREMMAYLTQYYSEDWTMPSGLYRSGNYLYLNGTSNTSSNYSYNNSYSNSSATVSQTEEQSEVEEEEVTSKSPETTQAKTESSSTDSSESENNSNRSVSGN
ncbi:penicillin-binding protein PBP1A [Streptococcus caprae]|uniref:Penicillin-binding protein PBP1A n=1 Tax=Streptococcus caprae TaxID=1640501 RepID=A0ABV8CTI8_9STRE